MGVWETPNGVRVEVIGLVREGRRAWIRVSQYGYLVGKGYFRNPRELATVVDLATLRPVE